MIDDIWAAIGVLGLVAILLVVLWAIEGAARAMSDIQEAARHETGLPR